MNLGELTKAEVELIERALMSQEFIDAGNTTTDPVTKEEIAQRRVISFPLRMKLYQAVNRAREQG